MVDAAFARVYEHHHQALYRYCRSILRHEQDAQDALQSAMMRAYVALQTERRELDLRPWLFRIAHNESINILRRRNRAAGELDDTLGDLVTLEERVDDRETLRLLRRDLADLPERQRSALVLRELNGLGHEEIAGVLGTTPSAVKQAIFEGRSALLRCREGRDASCAEIQRLLSDGDGRILRSRPVRAHLRACAGCREFRGALGQRPRELAALLPPLPGGAAAALLRGLFDGPAGTITTGGLVTSFAAKAAIVAAIAGGGGAVALHDHGRAAQDRAGAAPLTRSAEPATPAGGILPAVAHAPARPSSPQQRAPAGPARGAHRPAGGSRKARGRDATPAGPRTTTRPGRAPGQTAVAPGPAKQQERSGRPGEEADRRDRPAGPGEEADRHDPPAGPGEEQTAATVPPGQAKKQTAATLPPGQAKKHDPTTVPPGQAKKQIATTVPPGQAKKQTAATLPPGQAKKQAATTVPPGQAQAPAATQPVPPGQAKKAGGEPPAAGPPGQAGPGASSGAHGSGHG